MSHRRVLFALGTLILVCATAPTVCAYPALAHYRGRGDSADAASFRCVAP